MIVVSCAGCQHKLQVTDEFAGRSATCPRCKGRVTVPAASPPSMTFANGPSLNQGAPHGAPTVQPGAHEAVDGTVTGPDAPARGDRPTFDFLAPPQGPGELGRLGPYRVLKLLGAGGMGMVLQAEDTALKRHVALKVMRPELAAVPLNRERFQREAEAAASIEHPNVVVIHQVGEDRGVPFIAMPFLKGEALDARLKRDGRLSVLETVRIGRQVADGLAAAHERGLVHRDVKPANVWLEANTGLVKILDFGLARSVAGAQPTLTQSGTIVGTPAFMAPEQARGEPMDHRGDLFSRGSMLYHACAGETPFKGKDVISTLAAVSSTEPRPLRAVNPAVPQGLADLVAWLLAKDPARRPASAREVSEALAAIEREVQSAPVPVAGPVTQAVVAPVAPRRRRWLLYAGAIAAAAAIVIGLGLGGLVATLMLGARGGQGQLELVADATAASVKVQKDGKTVAILDVKDRPRVQLPAGEYQMVLAGGQGFQLVTDHVVLAPGERQVVSVRRLPGPESRKPPPRFTLDKHRGPVRCLAFSPDGDLLVSGGDDKSVKLWKTRDGGLITSLDKHAAPVLGVAFAPRDRVLASGAADGKLAIWDVDAPKLKHLFDAEMAAVRSLAFTADTQQLVVTGTDRGSNVWNLEMGKMVGGRFFAGSTSGWSVALQREGEYWWPVGLDNGQIQLWNWVAVEPQPALAGHVGPVRSLAMTRKGDVLASGGADHEVKIWDIPGTKARRTLKGHQGQVYGLAFSPDDVLLASAGSDASVRLWDVKSGLLKCTFSPHEGAAYAVAFAPGGKVLATCGEDGKVQLWDVATLLELEGARP